MKKSMVRATLFSSVSLLAPAIPAVLAFVPTQAHAATVCTGTLVLTGINVRCVDGGNEVVTGTTDFTPLNPVPQGLSLTSIGNTTTTLVPGVDGNTIATTAISSPGIIISSGGVLSLTAPDINVTTTNVLSDAVNLSASISITASLGDLSTHDGSSNALQLSSLGAITVTTGDLSASVASDALVVSGGAGAIDLTTSNIFAGEHNAAIISGSGKITLNAGTISGGGSGATDGVHINGGSGAINVTTGAVTETGSDFSNAFEITGTGAITINANGDISTAGDASEGILVSGGAGTITANFGNVETGFQQVDFGANSAGVKITGTGIIALNQRSGTTISTAKDGSAAVVLNGGTISGTLANISTDGGNANGATLVAGAGGIGLTIGNVTVHGPGSRGVDITTTASGSLNLVAGNVSTSGGDGIHAVVAGDSTIVAGNVNAHDGKGITVTATGSNSITAGTVTSSFGNGIEATGSSVHLTAAGVSTVVSFGNGIVVNTTNGDAIIRSGPVSTNGTSASGIVVNAAGNVDVGSCPTISTNGMGSIGINVTATGNVGVNCGTVSTMAADADGIRIAAAGQVNLSTGGVTTIGANADGVIASGSEITFINTGSIVTGGAGTDAVRLTASGGVGSGGINAATNADVVSDGGIAIDLNSVNPSGTGDTDLTTLAGTSIRSSGSIAINAVTAGKGNILVTNNAAIGSGDAGQLLHAIIAVSNGTGNVQVINNGQIGSNSDIVKLTAIAESINNALSAGTLSVSGSGAIFSLGNGVDLSTNGTGAATVNYTGRIDSDSDGIHVNTTTGAISVTTAGGEIDGFGGDGIRTTSTTGNQTITTSNNVVGIDVGIQALSNAGALTVNVTGGTVGGVTAGIELDSNGAKTVNVSSGATVEDGGPPAGVSIFGGSGGTLTVNNSGQVGLVGSTAVATQSITRAMINNLSGGKMDGRVDLSFLNDSISNTGTWNATGANNFYDGVDVVANNAGGVINTANGTTFDALEAFTNAGTVNTTGTLGFTTFATTLTNSGTINLGAASAVTGLNGVTSSGTINAAAGSSISGTGAFSSSGRINTAGAFTLAGFTALSNSGTLNLGPGTLTLPAVLFTNTGTINAVSGASTITGQTGFGNSGTINLSDGAPGDILTINSNFVGSGASRLVIDAAANGADKLVITGAASGTTQLFANIGSVITTPLLIVDIGTSTPDAFVLGSNVATPLIDVTLSRTGQDFFLTSAPNANAFQPVVLGEVAGDIWYQSADAYGAYSAQRRHDLGNGAAAGLGLWGQVYWNHELSGDKRTETVFGTPTLVDSRIATRRRGMQGGVDYGLGFAVIGITGGYEAADVNLRSTPGGFDLHGYNIGAYAIAGHDLGFYGGLLAKYDRAHAEATNPAFADVDSITVKSTGVEGEAGYRFGFAGVNADLGAGLAWVHSKVQDIASGGIAFDFDTVNSLRGRLGARIEGGPGLYLDARVLHEFKGESGVTLLSGGLSDSLSERGRGTWGRVETGIAGRGRVSPMASVWGEFGDVRGWGFRAGLRFGGPGEAPVAYVPPPAPPPPPPPPPPPASQTCPDGSVIDATATCPAPPPPPPPAPVERGERGN